MWYISVEYQIGFLKQDWDPGNGFPWLSAKLLTYPCMQLFYTYAQSYFNMSMELKWLKRLFPH